MPDFSQSAPGLIPETTVDHVLLAVSDLDAGVDWMHERYGLEVAGGGRHPGLGTANRIVPLGRQYLELIAVVDAGEAASSRLGRGVTRALAQGRLFNAWALRTRDMSALRAKLLAAGWEVPELWSGSRRLADGRQLAWTTQDIGPADEVSPLPFVIEWNIPDGLHPGESGQPGGELRQVLVGARDAAMARERLALLLGDSDLVEVRESERDGVEAVVLATPRGEITVGS